ncbi:hypothetical protein [Streptomyces cucumeris]|uniref:hypothetical protein n=1 Tax=Streptomyces cucumeris TaxID=2962890 RepID=UPI0020C89291|nr:hypothetical protein [Streptomyces sp. NEAU-Y11]MCP9205780.1 hypothetical protein [Streptomyces sp. NEAU-Y11]
MIDGILHRVWSADGTWERAPGPEAARVLREERAPLLAERETLTADDQERITVILREMPSRLAAAREGGAGD